MRALRINVIGTTGAGKTTLSRQVAQELGIADIELDELFWQPNWTETPRELFREKVKHAVEASESWVLHGNYTKTRDLIWPKATHIVWLDYPPAFIFFRLFRRTLRRMLKKEILWSGNTESFLKSFASRDSILVWFFKSYRKNATLVPELLAMPEHRHLKLIRLTSPDETKTLIRRLLANDEVAHATLA
ncbi:MAG: shikimate kinase [Bdellovibrionota bacterium]